jgi:hypothetical protein
MRAFPQIAQFVKREDLALYRIDPRGIAFVDCAKSFGHTELARV